MSKPSFASCYTPFLQTDLIPLTSYLISSKQPLISEIYP